jgi:hypothetical protein
MFRVKLPIRALMKEAVRTSETSANTYLTTQQYIVQDSKLHTRRRENLKSHIIDILLQLLTHT